MASGLPTRSAATNGTTARSSASTGQQPSRSPSAQSIRNGLANLSVSQSLTHRRNGSTTSSMQSAGPKTPASETNGAGGSTSSQMMLDGAAGRIHEGHSPGGAFDGSGRPIRKVRKLRSQYPQDSQERHVEYILVAAFDVDNGSIMEHQYPGAISGDESMLAELMLPDQAHLRREDWTIFFLHKDTTEEDEAREEARAERVRVREARTLARQKAIAEGTSMEGLEEEEEEEEDEDDGAEGPPLIYVLNLVNTKQDPRAPRGAWVKAMAICTRHPFLHIYKPLLLLALEDYFKNPYLESLERLYGAVNNMDLSLMPRLTLLERNILQATEMKDLFIEKFDQMVQQRMLEENLMSSPGADSPTRHGQDPNRPRPPYQLPRDTHEYETRVTYNGIPIPIKVPTAVSPEFVGDFSLLKLIQTFSAPHASSPQPFALHPHLTSSGAYTHPILILVNAVLTQKRIIFLGHNRPSGEVAEAVLAACALASGGVLQGFTRHAFPYTDLTKIDDLLNVPGFIAGVTNPLFGNHPEWWDLLCDIPSGRMKISPKIEQAPMTEGLTFFQQQHPTYAPSATGVLPAATLNPPNAPSPGDPTGDAAFMEDVQRAISARHGEPALRAKFRDYILKFTRLAAAFEETVFGASALYIGASEADAGAFGISGHGFVWSDDTTRARELAANAWRIEGWRVSRSYYALIQDLAALFGRRPIRSIDVLHQLDRLRTLKLSKDDSARIFLALRDAVEGYDGVCQLLAATPENHAGLFHLSLGLWHPDRAARIATVELLERVREHEAGRHFWRALGRFAKAALWRVRKEMDEGPRRDEELGASVGGFAGGSAGFGSGGAGLGGLGGGVGIGIAGVLEDRAVRTRS